jgi:hypothetical protein
MEFRQGLGTVRKVGAFLIRWENIESKHERASITYCVLIFGIAYGGLVPWCHLSPAIGYDEKRDKQMSLGPREQADYSQQSRIDAYLQREFDNFRPENFSAPLDWENRRRYAHVYNALQLVSIAEFRSVSGKEVCLLHLLTLSKYLEGKSS